MNFNYTDTLQAIYGIDDCHVTHIHGSLGDGGDLVLGHGYDPKGVVSYNHGMGEDSDTRVMEAGLILDGYFESTYKATNKVIDDNAVFFGSISSVENVFVVGHSVSNVDVPYFEAIKNSISRHAKWNVTYKDPASVEFIKNRMVGFGVNPFNIEFLTVDQLPD